MARGMCEIAEQVFDAPTRLGFIEHEYFSGLTGEAQTPEWAVACGLALSSLRSQTRGRDSGDKSTAKKMADWLGNFRERFR